MIVYHKRFFVRDIGYGSYIPYANGQKSKGITRKDKLPNNINPLLNCIGAHTSFNGYSSYVCIDIDCSKKAKEEFLGGNSKLLEKEKDKNIIKALKIKDNLESENIPCLLEDSIGGYHIWIFLKNCKQDIAFKFGTLIKQKFQLEEVFPKQEKLNGSFGNWVRIPGIYHSKDKYGNKFYSQIDIGKEFISIEEKEAQKIIKDFPSIPEPVLLEYIKKYSNCQEIKFIYDNKKNNEFNGEELPLTKNEFIKLVIDELNNTSGLCDTYEDFLKFAMAFKSVGLSYHEIDSFFKTSQNYDFEKNIKIYEKLEPKQIGFGTAAYYVKDQVKNRIKEISSPQKNKTKKSQPKKIKTTDKGPKLTVQLVENILSSYKDEVKYNKLTQLVHINNKPVETGQLEDMAYDIVSMFKSQSQAKVSFIIGVIKKFARKNIYNPILDWYNSLPKWTPNHANYIGQLASHIKGDDYIERKLQIILGQHINKWLNQEQARVPVICGDQGLGKSYFVYWLCPLKEYFIETSLNPKNKDDMLLASKFIMAELGELGGITKKTDQEALKSFFTRKKFILRSPYGRYETVYPHLCCWWGTANKEGGVLFDHTGHRRYMAINIDALNWEYINIPLNELWAQAKYIYKKGLYIINKDDKEKIDYDNEQQTVQDPIFDYLEEKYIVTGNHNDMVKVTYILNYLKDNNFRITTGTNRKIKAYFSQFNNVIYGRYRQEGRRMWIVKGIKERLI